MNTSQPTTRLAPSPTGDLHLGNLRTFALTWALARTRGWTLALRIEDLDGPRVRPGAVEATCEMLDWMGFDHDGPMLRQSADLSPYREAMAHLAGGRLVYPCTLSRAEVRRVASAPHLGEREPVFPAVMRPSMAEHAAFADHHVNHRFATPDETVSFVDRLAGRRSFRPCDEVGDFVIWTRQGVPAYQLAVVVDDARQGVTDVVRGDDLLPSAARQALLHRALGHEPPRWWHAPLVFEADGTRLAKRNDSRTAASYRREGVSAERLLGLLAWWLGVVPRREPIGGDELLAAFRPYADDDSNTSLRLKPATFTEEDHQWLLQAPTSASITNATPT